MNDRIKTGARNAGERQYDNAYSQRFEVLAALTPAARAFGFGPDPGTHAPGYMLSPASQVLSEDVSRRELNLTRTAETEQSAKLIPDGRNTLTKECGWPQRVIIAPHQTAGRIGEVCFVKKIEDLYPQLERRLLRQPRILKD